jgi:hypothetical protein
MGSHAWSVNARSTPLRDRLDGVRRIRPDDEREPRATSPVSISVYRCVPNSRVHGSDVN